MQYITSNTGAASSQQRTPSTYAVSNTDHYPWYAFIKKELRLLH